MRRLIEKLRKVKSPLLCKEHDSKKFPGVIANERCYTCELDMCYMCGNKHYEHGCDVEKSQYSKVVLQNNNQEDRFTADPYSAQTDINAQILRNFNLGKLMQFDIQQAICACGANLDHSKTSAICITCGSATCSNECHHHHIQQQDLCKFHHNFVEHNNQNSMRAIQFNLAKTLFDRGYAQGTPINRTSAHFLMGYLSPQRHIIYIQRGHRQYGNPISQTLTAMTDTKALLDYELNLMRQCDCTCYACTTRGAHPLIACEHACMNDQQKILRDYVDDDEYLTDCNCQCAFCSSGLTILKHRRIDCLMHCEHGPSKSLFNFEK